MDGTTFNTHKTILYLQLSEKIDKDFISIASHFKSEEVTLVPVKPMELDYFLTDKISTVILLTKTVDQLQTFYRFKKRWIDFYLNSKRMKLIHLNSFSEVKDYLSLKTKGYYINLNLPLLLKEIKEKVMLYSLDETEIERLWPGGRRAKLPSDVSS